MTLGRISQRGVVAARHGRHPLTEIAVRSWERASPIRSDMRQSLIAKQGGRRLGRAAHEPGADARRGRPPLTPAAAERRIGGNEEAPALGLGHLPHATADRPGHAQDGGAVQRCRSMPVAPMG